MMLIISSVIIQFYVRLCLFLFDFSFASLFLFFSILNLANFQRYGRAAQFSEAWTRLSTYICRISIHVHVACPFAYVLLRPRSPPLYSATTSQRLLELQQRYLHQLAPKTSQPSCVSNAAASPGDKLPEVGFVVKCRTSRIGTNTHAIACI